MTPSGYSGMPLIAKLGYKPGQTVFLVNSPGWFKKEVQDNGISIASKLPADWVHAFFASQKELTDFLHQADLNKITNGLWVSWPKKASGVPTDLNEQIFRDQILPMSWVDVKVAAIDQTWSGLKFLRRRKLNKVN